MDWLPEVRKSYHFWANSARTAGQIAMRLNPHETAPPIGKSEHHVK
jgi:hypothetical protein